MDAAAARELDRGLGRLAPDAAPEVRERLLGYVALLERWNRAFNLTAVRGTGDIVRRHLIESLSILPHLRGPRLLDVGTGAGVPGLVLAIARSDLLCTLIDGNGKKTRFCAQAAIELGLANVEVVQVRAQDYEAPGRFDTVTSRATMELAALWGIACPLLAPGGVVIALGAEGGDDALAALAPAPGRVEVLPADPAHTRTTVVLGAAPTG